MSDLVVRGHARERRRLRRGPRPRPRLAGLLAGALLGLALLAAAPAGAAPLGQGFWYGTTAAGEPLVHLHFFWTPTCPHCKDALPWVEWLGREHDWISVHSHALPRSEEKVALYRAVAASVGQDARSVPGFAFCERLLTGFHTAHTTGADILGQLRRCRDALAGGVPPAELPSAEADGRAAVRLPVLGRIDPAEWSLPMLTVALGGLDAFNPCAFFVLLFLLSLLVHARSRARMAAIGGIFVVVSGVVYFLFMSAWLNAFLLAGEIRWVTLAAGIVALVVAVLNIKDYFWLRAGPSLSIPESAKPDLYRRMRGVATAGRLAPMVAGTIILAIAANTYELLCTAGFPMVYTRVLTLEDLPTGAYYGYLALYNVVYVIPLAVIVAAFTLTLGSRKLSEREGRLLKLVSGYMMGALGVVLVTAPHLLSNVLVAAGLLAVALALTWLTTRLAPARAR